MIEYVHPAKMLYVHPQFQLMIDGKVVNHHDELQLIKHGVEVIHIFRDYWYYTPFNSEFYCIGDKKCIVSPKAISIQVAKEVEIRGGKSTPLWEPEFTLKPITQEEILYLQDRYKQYKYTRPIFIR